MRELLYRINGDTARSWQLPMSGSSLEIPCYFASISSLKTNLEPLDYVKFLTKIKAPHILVSAYDLAHTSAKNTTRMATLLGRAMKAGSRVMIDCGNYESYWKKDKQWSSKRYRKILRSIPHHLATIYDDHDLISGDTKNISIIEKETQRLIVLRLRGVPIPIIHASLAKIVKVTKGVANRLRPLLLAIPERELGDGIIQRIVTLVQIRRELNKLGTYIPIHLLGTGNPLSLLLFSAFGADTYDGLEWCQTSVDPDTALLLHFHQRELVGGKLRWKEGDQSTYQGTTLFHNVVFFESWMSAVRKALMNENVTTLMEKYFREDFLNQLKSQVKKVL